MSVLLFCILMISVKATIHVIYVWDGYYQFTPTEITIILGDTIQWLPLDEPAMAHTITSSNIPDGAEEFDEIWQAPADTFFQYVPEYVGLYEYVCTPHEESFNMVGSFTVAGTLSSVLELDFEKNAIYPNPSSNFITIKGLKNASYYRIFDLNGKQFMQGSYSNRIDVSQLSKGIYFIEIKEEELFTLRFIKE